MSKPQECVVCARPYFGTAQDFCGEVCRNAAGKKHATNKLIAALGPFAAAARQHPTSHDEKPLILGTAGKITQITVGDLRRARDALDHLLGGKCWDEPIGNDDVSRETAP